MLEPWMKESLALWQERLTDEELRLCRTLPHRLSMAEREQRRTAMNKACSKEIFWGFFDDGLWARVKRFIYTTMVHPLLKRR